MKAKGVPINEIIEFTDQASGQYKSKFTFYAIMKFDVPYTRHFYGVKHGKGPSDRSGGRFKKSMQNAVKSKEILLNARQIEQYCDREYFKQIVCNECNESLQRNISSDEVHDEVSDDKNDPHILHIVYNHPTIPRHPDEYVKGITGSRDWIHVVWNTGVQGVVQHKFFDCCCFSCVTHSAPCTQQKYSDAWITASIKGKHDLKNINTEDWFKSVADESSQNDVLTFEQFNNSGDEDDNGLGNEVVEVQNYEDMDDFEDYGDDAENGDDAEHEVFIENEHDEPIVYLDQNEVNTNSKPADVSYEVSDEVGVGEEDDLLEVMVEDYISSDCSEESEIEYPEEVISPSLDEDDPSINFEWKKVVKEMKMYNNYSTLRHYVMRTTLPSAKVRLKSVMEKYDVIDEIAMHFYPKNGPKDCYPIKTKADGSCLANALAHLLLGDEGRNYEIRVGATFTAVLRDNDFLDHNVIARMYLNGTENRPHSYAHYLGMLMPEITHLNENSIRTVYQHDVMANRLDGNYMGIWQFHHIAKAFK